MTSGSTTGDLQLMPLVIGDAEVLAALHVEALEAIGQQSWPAQAFVDMLLLPTTLGFKIEKAGEIAAFTLAQAVGGEAEILTIATAPAFRRQGLARTLIDILREQCRQRQCTVLWLEVHALNAAAIALYEKAGFLRKGLRPDYYRDMRTGERHTAIVMQCHVQNR